MGSYVMILVFWMLSFKPTFSLSSFTFIKRLFSSFLLSAIRVVSSYFFGDPRDVGCHVWMWELDCEEGWALKNWRFWTVVLEKTLERPLDCKKIQLVHPKGDQSWVFIGRTDVEDETNTLATWCEELTHLRRPWCWEGLGPGGEVNNRGWDCRMDSPTWWTWVWVNSRSWWWTGRPGVLRFMGSQRVRHDWATELNWTALPFQ